MRTATSLNGSRRLLHRLFAISMSIRGSSAPVVDAGPNRSLVLPNDAVLDGTVSDDGLPNPPGAVTTTWTQVSGPGTVTFGNASAISTFDITWRGEAPSV